MTPVEVGRPDMRTIALTVKRFASEARPDIEGWRPSSRLGRSRVHSAGTWDEAVGDDDDDAETYSGLVVEKEPPPAAEIDTLVPVVSGG